MNSTSESLLIRVRATNDFQAWSQFVDLYTPMIFGWARKTGLSSTDAGDLVQEVLTVAFEKLPTFDYQADQSFRGWLRTVTINKRRELIRKQRLKPVAARTSEFVNLSDQNGIDVNRLKTAWDLDYQRQVVAQAMEIIRPEFREITWNALYEFVTSDLDAATVAQKHSVSQWTIYGAKTRLIKRLKETLEGLLD